jgi:hypothetical protein
MPYNLLMPLAIRHAVGPEDRAAADLAHRHLGMGMAEVSADEGIGHYLGIAVAATPAGRTSP